MKVLITGGGGFLGSHLGDYLLKEGHEVVAMDIGPDIKVQHNLDNPKFRYVKASVMEFDILETLISKCDMVYHMAAVVGVEHYVADPFHVLNVNVNGTQNVLKLCHRYDKKLILASTSEVYGKSKDVPFREDGDRLLGSTEIDRWCYSTSKAVDEHFCFAYGKMGLRFVIVRFFNIYGPRLDKIDVGRVITIFMGQLLRGEDVTVIGDGKQSRCFTYIADATEALYNAGFLPDAEGGIFNIGVDVETPMLELAETMIKLMPEAGSKIKFVPQESVYGSSYEDVPRRVPDNTRMKKILGVTPKTSLEDGLRETMDWFKKEILGAKGKPSAAGQL